MCKVMQWADGQGEACIWLYPSLVLGACGGGPPGGAVRGTPRWRAAGNSRSRCGHTEVRLRVGEPRRGFSREAGNPEHRVLVTTTRTPQHCVECGASDRRDGGTFHGVWWPREGGSRGKAGQLGQGSPKAPQGRSGGSRPRTCFPLEPRGDCGKQVPRRKPEQAQPMVSPAPRCRASLDPPARLGVQSEARAWGFRPPGSAPLTHTRVCICPSVLLLCCPESGQPAGSRLWVAPSPPGVPASETGKDAVVAESKPGLLRSAGGELDGVSPRQAKPAQG